jgi:hypothetical protein
MLNSSNYVREEGVINSGETIAAEVKLTPGSKIYYCTIPNSITHLPDGAQITFAGGQFMTSNPDIIAYLDKIADKPTTPIYTKKDQFLPQLANAAEDAAMKTGDGNKVGSTASPEMAVAAKLSLKSTPVTQ